MAGYSLSTLSTNDLQIARQPIQSPIRMPLSNKVLECPWYLAQQLEDKWSRMMKAFTSVGVGYAITRVPKKIMPFRPYIPGTQCIYMVGGARKSIKALRNRNSKSASDPNANTFVTDKDERERGNCLTDAIITACSSSIVGFAP
jgi:hypothetical protein